MIAMSDMEWGGGWWVVVGMDGLVPKKILKYSDIYIYIYISKYVSCNMDGAPVNLMSKILKFPDSGSC